ncbi:olfactory receptor 1D2-like [Acinonyx jubatus]|uniref:Olfactory receptor n=1 Tax=Acinonyx jubatus TaxID=32536 RepID=A0A6J0A2S9_ACIJB|nr:olfactory receptor 1D2-like [Acinonyx jubatus]
MHQGNQSISKFFLLGLTVGSEQQKLIFMLFLCMYLVTMVGNLLIILAIINDAHLHSPMYFFLANLSFNDICFTTTTIPKMLADIPSQSPTISFAGCLTQMYFFMLLVDLDNFLLAAMAYDRYVAICHPLHYAALLNPKRCALLVVTPWVISNLVSILHLTLFKRLHLKSYILCEFFHNSPISLGTIIPFSPLGPCSTLFCHCIIYHNKL